MSDKPSLYVVEKKEVIILVVLFVLVTVLSFTLGVRYGESVGKKAAHEDNLAAREHGDAVTEPGSGTLGQQKTAEDHPGDHGEAKHEDKTAHSNEHGEAKREEKTPGGHGDEHAADKSHGEDNTAAAKHEAKSDSHSPEAAAKSSAHPAPAQGHEAVDKNSDEYLLNALKDAGVEPPGGKAPKGAKLPEDVKESRPRVVGGSYVIQVGSHPSRAEAEAQVKQLKARKVSAEILSPFRDKHGEWHRVVVGSYKNKREADKDATGLKSRGSIVSFFVWRLP